MSNFNLARKLRAARKAWKSFKDHLQSRLQRHPKFINRIKILRRRCVVAWRSTSSIVRRKVLALTKRRQPPPHLRRRRRQCYQSYSAIYVDELFPGPATLAEPGKTKEGTAGPSNGLSIRKTSPDLTKTHAGGEIQAQRAPKVSARIPGDDEKGLAVGKGKAKAGDSSRRCAPSNKWKIPSLPQFRGIDERAEEFIAKFHQDRRLEREQSILEFQEMLKRSA